MTGASSQVSIGVIGCGTAAWIGHLPWIWGHPLTKVGAVCDSSPERLGEARARYAVPFATTDWRELVARPEIQAVVICTPQSTHAEIAVGAAATGKHILIEKPMARNVAECEAIMSAAVRAGVVLMIAHEKRFHLACAKIQDIIASGAVGMPFYLSVNWGASVKLAPEELIPKGYGEGYRWRWTDESAGGGILLDHLPHYVDLWRWWTSSEVESVSSEIQNIARDFLNRPEIGRWEDSGVVLMRFRNGAVGTFQTGTVGRGLSPILHNGSGLGEWSEFGYVFGTRGQIAFDLPPWDSPENGRVMVWSLEAKSPADRGWYQVEFPDPRRSPGGPLSPATNESHMFYRQIDAFARAILNGAEPPVSGEDGRATVAVVEAVYESQKSQRKTPVPQAEP